MRHLLALLFFGLFICGYCQAQEEANIPYQKCLDSHGGLSHWNSFGSLTFERVAGDGVHKHILDLKNRNEIVQGPNSTLAFISDGLWVNPDQVDKNGNRKNNRFYKNLWFYFFALPFVTSDPGVNRETITDETFEGTIYNRVKITFDAETGDAPDDQYILWLEKETGQLKFINYSVTYRKGKEASEKYNALVYDGWQEVNGIKVPTGFTGFAWSDNKLGKKRYNFTFQNVKFDPARPSDKVFEKPEGAYFEKF